MICNSYFKTSGWVQQHELGSSWINKSTWRGLVFIGKNEYILYSLCVLPFFFIINLDNLLPTFPRAPRGFVGLNILAGLLASAEASPLTWSFISSYILLSNVLKTVFEDADPNHPKSKFNQQNTCPWDIFGWTSTHPYRLRSNVF